MHVLRDPERKQMPSIIGERGAKTISTYAAAPNCDKGRMLAVSMNPPDDVGVRILRHVLTAGDRRYWSWSATKAQSNGKVRTSLMWELNVDRGNLSRGLGPLLEDGIVEIGEKQSGCEVLLITHLGRIIFAELRWRWFLREAATEFLQPMADSYGWQEISIQVDRYVSIEEVDPTRKADVIYAAKEQLKDGVEAGGGMRLPSSTIVR
jgi:hypothetical protein